VGVARKFEDDKEGSSSVTEMAVGRLRSVDFEGLEGGIESTSLSPDSWIVSTLSSSASSVARTDMLFWIARFVVAWELNAPTTWEKENLVSSARALYRFKNWIMVALSDEFIMSPTETDTSVMSTSSTTAAMSSS
jgi:hypothetical protein